MIYTLISIVLLVICIELFMWKCFLRKHEGVEFPREVDSSFFRFFTIGRMRTLAMFHTTVLCAVSFLSIWYLW